MYFLVAFGSGPTDCFSELPVKYRKAQLVLSFASLYPPETEPAFETGLIATKYAYRLQWCSVAKLCESRLSAIMIEDRALTGKQYESVDGV